jgi:hypothetical protein
MLQFYVALAAIAVWWFFLRPRMGYKDSPPVVTSSSVVPVPVLGVFMEFMKSPNDMMRRCYRDFGKVFTIPVRFTRLCVCMFLLGLGWVGGGVHALFAPSHPVVCDLLLLSFL